MKLSIFLTLILAQSFAMAFDYKPFDVVNPDDDELLGHIQVKSPPTPKSPMKIMAFTLTKSNVPMKPDVPFRLPEGKYCVYLSVFAAGDTSQMCDVSVFRKKITEVPLSALSVKVNDEIFAVGVGLKPIFQLKNPAGSIVNSVVNGIAYLPTFGGTFTAMSPELPAIGETQIPVLAGEVVDKEITLPDYRATLLFKLPQRAFANADGSKPDQPNINSTVVHRTSSLRETTRFHIPAKIYVDGRFDSSGLNEMVNLIAIDPAKAYPVRFYPTADLKTFLYYEIVINNTFAAIEMKPQETKTIEIKRIDVNNVLLTREDGTKYYVPGEYQVFEQNPVSKNWKLVELQQWGQANVMNKFKTPSGLDVLPGTYKIMVNYTTEEGPKSRDFVLDLN